MADIEKVIEFLEDDKIYLFKVAENPNYTDADRRKADDLYCDIKEAIQTIRELQEQINNLANTIDENLKMATDIAYQKGASDMEKAKQIIIDKLQEQIPKWHLCSEELPHVAEAVAAYTNEDVIKAYRSSYGGEWRSWKDDTSLEELGFEIIAWTELPKFEEVE